MNRKPNVILINTHDSGCLFGCYGVREVQTPLVDALAQEGVRFNRFFATNPTCSPSRASLTTGRYPTSHGVIGGCHGPDFNRLRDDERHISSILADNGYHCESFGLKHESCVGDLLGFHRCNYEIRPTLERYSCEVLAPIITRFLEQISKSSKPFYAQIGFFETHQPFDFGGIKPDQTNGIYIPGHLLRCPENEEKMALLQGGLKKVDQAIGSILESLEKYGLKDNTMVIFTVDHGIEMPRAKFTLYDPGIRVPLIIRWPDGGITGGREFSQLTQNVDILPTILELLGLPAEDKIEGMSFAASLKESVSRDHRKYIFAGQYGGDARAVRNERFKLIRNFSAKKLFSPPVNPKSPYVPGTGCPLVELYDFETDPNEFYNVAENPEYADVRKELDLALWQWMEQIKDPIFNGATPHWMWAKSMVQCPLPLSKRTKGDN